MIYFTSDLHFYHTNIIRHCSRPFSSVEEMNETLIHNWNERVQPKDTVYILGDVTMRGPERAMEILGELRGKKYLVRGNHDNFAGKEKFELYLLEWIKDYYELHYQNNLFVLSHYPMLAWNKSQHGSYQLHGHQHNKPEYNEQNREAGIRRYDVGVDANGYAPVSIEEILAYFADTPMENSAKCRTGE